MDLEKHHLDMLHASAIADEVIAARGYRSVTAVEHKEYEFAKAQQLAGLLIPLWGVGGGIRKYQLRPDKPRISKDTGRVIKYESMWNEPNMLDINPLMQPLLKKPRQVIFITEGSKKGDALASYGCCAISLTGVWNWRGKDPAGASYRLPDWDEFNIKGSRFVIAFDSDIYTNNGVNGSARRLQRWLLDIGKADRVNILQLPRNGADKIGVDDYLASMLKGINHE